MRSISALFVLTLLGGCSDVGIGLAHHPLDCAIGIAGGDCLPGTPGYNNGGGQRSPQETIETRRTNDDDECRSYGLTFGTSEYAHCRETMLTLHVSQDQAATVDRRARAAAIGATMPRPPQTIYVAPCTI